MSHCSENEPQGQFNRSNASTKEKQERSKKIKVHPEFQPSSKIAVSEDSIQTPIPSNGKTLEKFDAGIDDAPEQSASFNRDNDSTRSIQAKKKLTSSAFIDGKTQEKNELEDSNRRQYDTSPTIEKRHAAVPQHNDTRGTDSDSSSLPSDVQDAQKSEEHQRAQKGPTRPPSLKTLRRLTDGTDNQYIRLHIKIKGLPYSAKLQSSGTTWSLLAEQCLVTIGNTYVARVAIERIDELDAASDFCSARDILINSLKIVQVLYDETKQKIVNCVESIKTELHNLKTKCATDSTSARCLLEMRRVAENCGYKITDEFRDQIVSSSIFQNEKLESTFVEILDKRIELQKRSIFEAANGEDGHDFDDFFENSLKEIFEEHQTRLQEICSPRIKSSLTDFTPHCCMLLREADVKLFSDLEGVLPETVLQEVSNNLVKRITDINHSDYSQSLPIVNEVYLYICKSLIQMKDHLAMEFFNMEAVEYRQNHWQIKNIEGINVESAPHRCIVSQLQMLVAFANHFEPGKSTVKEKFPYQLKMNQFGNALGMQGEQNLWHCLVDSTMFDILQQNFDCSGEYCTLLYTLTKCITSENSMMKPQESVRILTHDTLEFVAEVENSGQLIIQDTTGMAILRNHVQIMNIVLEDTEWNYEVYQQVMDAFKHFWVQLHNAKQHVLIKLPSVYFKQKVIEIVQTLLCIASKILEKHVSLENTIRFFKSFNELLVDITELSFEWFVHIESEKLRSILFKNRVIKRVDNKLSNPKITCYRVEPGMIDKFTTTYTQSNVPNHFMVETIIKLLNSITEVAQMKEWKSRNKLSLEDQVNATTQLINAVRGSLPYIEKHSNNTDFESFNEKFDNAFDRVIKEADSVEDFSKRVSRIDEMFWHLQISESFVIQGMLPNTSQESLLAALEVYNKQFKTNMGTLKAMGKYTYIKTFLEGALGKLNSKVCSEWTVEFKQSVVPKFLAAFAAIWCTKFGKYLPTFIILSLFIILGVRQSTTGTGNHLAQIPTGQSKSTVLAFAAAVLAFLGYDVVIVDRNEYSATKECCEFRELYRMCSIDSRISYKTVESMASNQTQWIALKAEQYICNSIGLCYTKTKLIINNHDSSKSVLLIDEIDALFIDKFHENSYIRTFSPVVPGLGKVQQKIWELVQTNSVDEVFDEIACFVRSSTDYDVKKLRSLIDQKESYTMFESISEPSEVQYTNDALFSDHFERMIKAAKTVHDNSTDESFIRNFTLDSNGVVTGQWNQEVCQSDNSTRYIKTFAYFKLRQENFIQNVTGVNNFGYLVFDIVSYVYGKLLEVFSSILGVFEVRDSLNAYKKITMKQDSTKTPRTTITPSIFGEPKLQFDEGQNFQCLSNADEWRQAILFQINAVASENRSVIVVFDAEVEITQFRQCFAFQLAQLNGLTIVTKDKSEKSCMVEPLTRRTATLMTREMVFEFDYRSSVSVESNGGVHVIQTFFSLDSKEESRIKALTARRGNRGSYELIVSREHLAEPELMDVNEGSIDYSFLDNFRKRRAEVTQDIEAKHFERHDKSEQFWKNIDN